MRSIYVHHSVFIILVSHGLRVVLLLGQVCLYFYKTCFQVYIGSSTRHVCTGTLSSVWLESYEEGVLIYSTILFYCLCL